MRIAILSDIHGNLEALEAVIEHLAGESVERVVCLGDLVGYGADPNPCCARVREVADGLVAGNHDYGAVGLTDVTPFNPFARKAIEWTARMLDSDNRRYLELLELTLVLSGERATLVHATPGRPEAWEYVFESAAASREFGAFTTQCCFVGHTHVPICFAHDPDGRVTGVPLERLDLRDGFRYVINVGSVGQPRDGDPRAAYAVYDDEAGTIEMHRVDYDIEKASEKIIKAGLPPPLAQRLSYGH